MYKSVSSVIFQKIRKKPLRMFEFNSKLKWIIWTWLKLEISLSVFLYLSHKELQQGKLLLRVHAHEVNTASQQLSNFYLVPLNFTMSKTLSHATLRTRFTFVHMAGAVHHLPTWASANVLRCSGLVGWLKHYITTCTIRSASKDGNLCTALSHFNVPDRPPAFHKAPPKVLPRILLAAHSIKIFIPHVCRLMHTGQD